MTEAITISARDGGAMPAEIARPATTPAKAIVMVAPIFGIDDNLRNIMHGYANAGYLVVTPDMFWRTIPGPLGREGEEGEKARKRADEFDIEQGVKDLGDVMDAVRAMPECGGKVAVFGYCFGGRYAFLAGTRLGADGAVSFHGVGIGDHLEEVDRLGCPISIHVGDSDPVVPMDEITATKQALAGRRDAEIEVYAGVGHGFTGKGRKNYNEHADYTSSTAALALMKAI